MIGVAVCIETTLTTLAMEPVAAFRFHLFRMPGVLPELATLPRELRIRRIRMHSTGR